MAAEAAMERLPPGVYFNPAPDECVNDYLLPWARGERLPEMGRYIHEESIYRQGPDALRRAHAPGTTRAFEPKWYFLSRCKKRGGRAVATGGTWTVEQKQRILEAADDDGDDLLPGATRKSFGFFVGERKTRKKTPWLMEEFTAGGDGGGGEKDADVPVLCRIYVSPRATNDEKRAIFGEAGVPVDADRKKKPERVVLPAHQFDALAKLLPASCRRRLTFVGKGQAEPPPPPDVLGHRRAPPPFPAPQIIDPTAPPPPVHLGRQRSQAAPPPAVLAPHHSPATPPPLQPNVPVRRHGHPLPPSPPRPDADQSSPSSLESSTLKQEELAIRPAKRARQAPHHAPPPPPPQDTSMDAFLSKILQETEPNQEMLPFDACQAANEPFRGSFTDLLLGTPLLPTLGADDDGFDFGKFCEISRQQQMDDGEPLPDIPLDVEFFATADFTSFPPPT